MKILHINTYDTGGAANACLRIHKALLKKGVDSKVLLFHKTPIVSVPETYQFNYWDGTFSQLDTLKKAIRYFLYDRKLRRQQLPYTTVDKFSFPTTIYDVTHNIHYQEADLVQLNWVSDFLDERSFFEKNSKPVIWRMADLYACGGGNHYQVGFDTEVYAPYLEQNIKIREEALAKGGDNLHFVPISSWVQQKAEESTLIKDFPKTVIHCGVDIGIFKPIPKNLARQVLGLPLHKKIIGCGAQTLTNPRKGMSFLKSFIDEVKDDNLYFTSFGGSSLKTVNERVINLGGINDELLLSFFYSAIDVFVTPAIEDAFGQVIIEALACGTPVVSFRTGGAIDAIQTGLNGILVSDVSSVSLSEALLTAINTEYDKERIVNDAVSRFDIDKKADEYIALYNKILTK